MDPESASAQVSGDAVDHQSVVVNDRDTDFRGSLPLL
jgi:hypothetical protein